MDMDSVTDVKMNKIYKNRIEGKKIRGVKSPGPTLTAQSRGLKKAITQLTIFFKNVELKKLSPKLYAKNTFSKREIK